MQSPLNQAIEPATSKQPVLSTPNGVTASPTFEASPSEYANYNIIRRNGSVVAFEPSKISVALMKAFLAVRGTSGAASAGIRDTVTTLTEAVVKALMRSRPSGGTFHIEDVQDQVELGLMRGEHHDVARSYVLYREQRKVERASKAVTTVKSSNLLQVMDAGKQTTLDLDVLRTIVESACANLGENVIAQPILDETRRNLYENVKIEEVYKAAILAARTLIEKEPAYTRATARLLLHMIRREVLGQDILHSDMEFMYPQYFGTFIARGIKSDLLDPRLAEFDLVELGIALKHERDFQFDYLGLQTLYDRYFLHVKKQRIELPQAFFMRVAMGLALNETNKEARAIEFYNVLSSFDFMSSTPTLFNSGTLKPQLSSCYLTTVPDDLDGIYEAIKDNAMLSKFAGGLGNDWTRVRSMGSHIKGTNGESQGVVPFLKVVNDTAIAVNQGGKRKGAVCTYLETWHLDMEEFLELRKNTGDDRRRCHDMNTANWIPDLFMKRVISNGNWTLFSPATCPDLHDKFGQEFEQAYTAYEEQAAQGLLTPFKTLKAVDLWRKMLTMLFETGHPWITFKDACNVRSPQQHVGVVHSSNLCTEITLNTNDREIAVCNLGSINLAQHVNLDSEDYIDHEKLRRTVTTAMRMLDNVIDINFYAVKKARDSNARHRPVGLGMMGFQDALYQMRVPYASDRAVAFADQGAEALCYYAYQASTELAAERGSYSTFKGSLWDRGLLPLDTLDMLSVERGMPVEVDRSSRMDWASLRSKIKASGMRNSNCVAIAPTATIANIVGVDASIEPCFGNLSVKSNLSGEFTVVNEYLVNDLRKLNLWDSVMVLDLKHFEGSLKNIDRIPQQLRDLYATAFEIEPKWLVEAAARRQKWIDQAQSLNIYLGAPSGKVMDETYKLAWKRGLKTTYYLRANAAAGAEKSTIKAHREPEAVPKLLNGAAKANGVDAIVEGKACSIDNPDCESCQ